MEAFLLENLPILLCFLFGVVLLIVEVFMPGFGLPGISGIILASRLGSAQPTAGTTQDLNVVAACILGGNSLAGGVSTVFGTLIGVAIMNTIVVSLTLMHVSAYWQNVCIGVILVVAICLDEIRTMAKQKA